MTFIPNVADILATLEQSAPDIYAKCHATLVDKKGNEHQKKCVINLKTGDVFKNRAIQWTERANFCLLRRYSNHHNTHEAVQLYAYRCAQVIDNNIVLTMWAFGDYYNNPNTTRIDWSWYGDNLLPQDKLGEKVDASALFNVKLSTPRIASIVMVTPNKEVLSWDDIDSFGLLPPMFNNSEDRYLSQSLLYSIYHSHDAKQVVGLTEAFKDAFSVGYLGANRYVAFDSHKDIPLFMKAANLTKKQSVNQDRIDQLAAIKLPDRRVASFCDNTICYADRVNAEWTVLRWYRKLRPSEYVETSRMYVNKTDALNCRSDLKGDWVYAGAKIKAETFNADKIVLQFDDVFDGTKLEYFKHISTEIGNRSAALYMLTMYPEFEKLCKSGLEWICNIYLSSPYQMSWKTSLKEMVGHIDWNAKNILKMIGMNRHQVEKIAEYRKKMEGQCVYSWQTYYLNSIICKLKRIFGARSISSIDNDTFDYIVDSLNNVDRLAGCYTSGLILTFEMYHNEAMYFIKDLNEAMKKNEFISMTGADGYRTRLNVDRLYYDTMQMIHLGNYTDVLRPRFSSVEELLGHHNVMVDLINANKMDHEARVNAQYNNSFITNFVRWQKWEWDEDDSFCVIAPKAPIDVAIEGITLRHCVKSYIPSVANGHTNIMFIRRKGSESEPFFTVEVDKSDNIRQVHGMCNCNTESVEGLTDFVKRWSKLKKLKYNQSFANGCRVAG